MAAAARPAMAVQQQEFQSSDCHPVIQKVDNNEAFIISIAIIEMGGRIQCLQKVEMADPAQKLKRVGQQLETNILGSSIYETKYTGFQYLRIYWVTVSTKPLLDTSS